MSTQPYDDWLDSLQQKAGRHTLLFLHLGAAHEPARRALTAAGLEVSNVKQYLLRQKVHEAAALVLDEVEHMTSALPDVTFGELRESVFVDIDAGKRFILLSRSPRAAFPAVPGSSLLDDATFVHGPRESIGNYVDWPACRIDKANPEHVLQTTLSELGPEICASLDRVIFDCLLLGEDALSMFSARELEALEGSGLISFDGTRRLWNFPKHLNQLKVALADVLAQDVKPQTQLADVSRGLWELERLIRRTIRTRAVAAWGDQWRSQCLQGDLGERVLGRATDATYLGANSIKLIRDPLEWLTLGELLDLKTRKEIGHLGLNATHWRKFGEQVLPIRNRLAHMRTLYPADATEVTKWLRVLELKLTSD